MTIVIRPLQATDGRSLRHLFRRCFNWMKLPFLPAHPPGFVAIKGKQICGGIVFNGRRLWQWHPGIWAGIAILCLVGIGLP